jgi:hypothetical protein
MLRRASAIAPPDRLSQPTITTQRRRVPTPTSSMESATISRLMSEAFMPSVPIDSPSEIEIVFTSMGVPPAARTPAITRWASSR